MIWDFDIRGYFSELWPPPCSVSLHVNGGDMFQPCKDQSHPRVRSMLSN